MSQGLPDVAIGLGCDRGTPLATVLHTLDAALAQGGPIRDQAQLLRLQRKAERNAICLQSAARGIRSAVRRLQEVRRAATGLATYDDKGRRVEIAGQGRLSARF